MEAVALLNKESLKSAEDLETAIYRVEPPLQRWESKLHPWVNFLVLPLFVLANSGVHLEPAMLGEWSDPLTLGIAAALILGKPIGIGLNVLGAVKLKISSLPEGVGPRHILGAGVLSGIGFTMALFIAGLAFSDPDMMTLAKLGIFVASLVSGIAGWMVLKWGPR